MFNLLKHTLLSILLCTSFAVQAQKTSGTDFWMAFIQNEDTDTLSTDFFYLRLFLSAQEASEVTVSNEKLGYEKKVSVAANSVEILILPFHDFNMTEYGVVTNKSVHITSDNPVSVYAENYQAASCDATLALPTTACGSYYIVQNNVSRSVSDYYFFLPSVFNVIAFEDNTVVEITPTLETSDGKPANQPFRITLNKGDVYQVCNKKEDMGKGLSGSQVLALDGKKVAVYTGNRCSNVPDSQITGDSDILFDVSYPVSSWGKKFIIHPFLEGNYDIIKCTACKDDTKIYKDGNLLATINALESYEFQIAETDGAIKVETTEPVSVYQYMTSSKYIITRSIGGPSFQYVAPIEQAIEEISFSTVPNISLATHYLNVIIKTEDVETTTLNGETGYATFTPVDAEYSTASVPIKSGQYTLKAEHGFIANVYGQGKYISYSYSAGSKIEPINIEGEYVVNYDGNGATNGTMLNHIYKIGVDETTTLDANRFERKYNVMFNTTGGETLEDQTCKYEFNGWAHEEPLTQVTKNMENWYNISSKMNEIELNGLINISNNENVNYIKAKPEAGVRERLYSKPIYMPAGDFDLSFAFCSPTGYKNLTDIWDNNFKCAACDKPQKVYGNDYGMYTKNDEKSAVLLEGYTASEVFEDRNFTIYANGEAPVFITINCGNLYDGRSYEFRLKDFTLSKDNSTTLYYTDKEATKNLVREEGGIVNLKALWKPNSITLPLPQKEGFTFAGWNTKRDGTGTTYMAGDPFTTDADTILFALWKTEPVTVSKPCGEGSKSCPFHIKTPGELLYFAAVINGNIDTIEVNEYANAILDNDLDLSRVCSPELGSWTPIGTGSSRFRGLFNGHNHTIKNLYINGSAEGLGLFGKVSNCEIRNLIIGPGLIISSGPSVGSIVGVGVATIIDCHNYADIVCASKFNGGIIGYASKDSYIEKCHNEGNITGTSSQTDLFGVGGIAGALSRGTITDCYSLGSISGQSSRVGGIVGSAENCLITNCYSYGDVESKKNDHGGGICAIAEAYPDTKVEHSYYYNSLDKVGQQPQMQRPQSDFNDGTIFALLNEHTPNLWRQEEGKYPVFIDTVFNPISYQKRYVTICEGERYRFEGKDYSVSGTYLPSCSCDGDTLILTTLAGSKETVSLCKGDSVLFNGKYIKEAGTYIATAKQCGDTLIVDILSPSMYTFTETINSGENYRFGSQVLTKEGTYTDTLKGAAVNGCDSIVTLHLKVVKCMVEGDDINVTICSGDTFTIGGQDFNKPGSYKITLTSSKGCDSIVTLNIKTARTDTVVINEFIVNETHYEGYGFTVDVKLGTLNFFTKTLKNQVGCDSTVTLVLNSLTQPIPVYDTICKGETYTVNGETFSQTGDYKVVLGKYQGCDCDSSMMLHLFVAEPNDTTFHDTISIKEGNYKRHGFNIDRLKVGTNTYTETYKNQFGCDSVVSIVLTVTSHTVYGDDIYEEICENETLTYNDSTFKPGKTYTLHETTALGYDSITVLNIKSLPTSKSTYMATVEVGDTYTKNGFDLPEQEKAGVFYHQLTTTNVYGCDSIVTLQLTVEAPKDSIIIPTLFTPHTREGKNDIFMEGYEVYIYDRYGNLVCHSKNGWDGYYRGKKADPGVYIYTLFLKDDRKKKGSIEIYK